MSRYGGRWAVEVTQNRIDTTCGIPTLNPRWTFTDAAGHDHRYDHGYPTLDYIIDASHWCDGYEGYEPHDPHEHVDESHYECLICREVIEPGILPAFTPQSVPGTVDMTLKGPLADGSRVTAMVYEGQEDLWRRLMMTTTAEIRDRICEQWVESHPDSIYERSFSA